MKIDYICFCVRDNCVHVRVGVGSENIDRGWHMPCQIDYLYVDCLSNIAMVQSVPSAIDEGLRATSIPTQGLYEVCSINISDNDRYTRGDETHGL